MKTKLIATVMIALAFWSLARAETPEPSFGALLTEAVEESTATWDTSCPLHDGGPEQQEVVCYAWQISDHDKDFLLLIKAENGELTPYRQHPGGAWCKFTQKWDYDFGFGISRCYHPEIVNDPRYFTDWRWNLEQTYKLYKDGVTFYAWPHRYARSFKHFTF